MRQTIPSHDETVANFSPDEQAALDSSSARLDTRKTIENQTGRITFFANAQEFLNSIRERLGPLCREHFEAAGDPDHSPILFSECDNMTGPCQMASLIQHSASDRGGYLIAEEHSNNQNIVALALTRDQITKSWNLGFYSNSLTTGIKVTESNDPFIATNIVSCIDGLRSEDIGNWEALVSSWGAIDNIIRDDDPKNAINMSVNNNRDDGLSELLSKLSDAHQGWPTLKPCRM